MGKTVIPYRLVQHLREICEEQKEYEPLLSVWQINRESCHKILENIIINYPHYTLHDLSHSESIITNIEMLLGAEAIRRLSPTDTWLLLQAAYLHDFGMVLAQDEIDMNWGTDGFQEYLHELEASFDAELRNAAKYINGFGKINKEDKEENIWPLRVRKYVTLIIADYYRGRHASMSREYIAKLAKKWGLDLGFNGLIPQRLIFLLGDVSYLHTEDRKAVLNLDYVANGFNGDYIHPRFVAEMLRMGDLLDMDNNRFNPFTEKVIGMRPASSDIHIKKHLSATHIVITPSLIEYRADCGTEEVYRETQRFATWLKQETDFLTLNWRDIMPEDIEGSAPRLNEPKLLLRGEEDIAGVADLRFGISQEKAFETIEGANIYDSDYIFLREVIQNALDACKLQLWNDLCAGKYSAWMGDICLSDLKPFQIDSKIYENYKVQVVFEDSGDFVEVVVKDNGTGISTETFKRICNVGTSYAGDKNWKKTLKEMPRWLKPTAGFGIGLQSIFLVADKFEIYSCSNGEGIKAVVESRKKNGYVQLHKDNSLKSDGTQLHVKVRKTEQFNYSVVGSTSEYIHTQYDPFSGENLTMQFYLMDEIINNCSGTFLPIEIYFEDEMQSCIEPYCWPDFKEKQGNYMYQWLDGTKSDMQLWDMENDVFFECSIREGASIYVNTSMFFKGMAIENFHPYVNYGVSVYADFYGLDSKKYLSLDRKKIKPGHYTELNKISTDAVSFFRDKVWEHVGKVKDIKPESIFPERENPEGLLYSFWRMVSVKNKKILVNKYKALFEKSDIKVEVFKENEDGAYEYTIVHMLEVMGNLRKAAAINVNLWPDNEMEKGRKFNYCKYMEKVINANKGRIPYKIIVADKEFSDALFDGSFSRLILLKSDDGIEMITDIKDETDKNDNGKVYADDETIKIIFGKMVESADNLIENIGWYHESVRRYAPALGDYETLAVKRVERGIYGNNYGVGKVMISPITSYDLKKLPNYSLNGFVDFITQKDSYGRLLDYTYENQYDTGRYTKDELHEAYKKLIKDYCNSEVWKM